jgi:hypothetical protein
MNDYSDAAVLGTGDRFAIGQPVPRSEDPVLLWGEGHYRDDFNRPTRRDFPLHMAARIAIRFRCRCAFMIRPFAC